MKASDLFVEALVNEGVLEAFRRAEEECPGAVHLHSQSRNPGAQPTRVTISCHHSVNVQRATESLEEVKMSSG